MHKFRIEKVLVVDDEFRLRGLITVKDIQRRATIRTPPRFTERLLAGAAVGVGGDTETASKRWCRRRDVTWWTPPMAIRRACLTVSFGEKNFPNVQVIGGNIAPAMPRLR